MGQIQATDAQADGGRSIAVALGGLEADAIRAGDSIAVNGVCLTVTRLLAEAAHFDVSGETLERCLVGQWRVGDRVNLEPALTPTTPLGGHLVSGHVDGIGRLQVRCAAAGGTQMRFSVPPELGRFVAVKGSIAVDGVSLTVNRLTDADERTEFEVMLVPHTLRHTTLDAIQPPAPVHIEVDMLARYVGRLAEFDAAGKSTAAVAPPPRPVVHG